MTVEEGRHPDLTALQKVKLVIWDLDDTLWKGTLSDGKVDLPQANKDLIQLLTQRGIMQSICSKNDWKTVQSQLNDMGIAHIFVFPSVNWEPKGPRIKQIIKNMQLSEKNVLFIDDNHLNLEEARYYCHDMMIAEPSIIETLIEMASKIGKDDKSLSRLKQYRILEEKEHAAETFHTNEEFLMQSNICVEIHTDCVKQAERLYELTIRSNQLNFTKDRPTREAFDAMLNDPSMSTGYVSVYDKYGDYGIVGFFAIRAGRAIHFLFSCRILNMGVEQYVYAQLKYPTVEIVPPISGSIASTYETPNWINQPKRENEHTMPEHQVDQNVTVLIKGPCDLCRGMVYLKSSHIDSEVTFTDNRKRLFNYQNHIANIYTALTRTPQEINANMSGLPYESNEWFQTKLTSKKYNMVFLSLLSIANHSVYKNKHNGFTFALGSRIEPMSDARYENLYINHGRQSQMFDITPEDLRRLWSEYDRVDDYVDTDMSHQIESILSHLPKESQLCFILTNEHTYLPYDDDQAFKKHVNDIIRRISSENPRVLYIDINDYVKSGKDTTTSYNHFTSRVYYQLSLAMEEKIQQCVGLRIKRNWGVICNASIFLKQGITVWKDAMKQLLRKLVHSKAK